MFKSPLKRLLGERNLGYFDYLTKPSLKSIWGGAFNGQVYRRKIFAELVAQLKPTTIVETGSFRGNTTAFMAATGIPVHSVEYSDRLYGYVQMRFLLNRHVLVNCDDSRSFLRGLAKKIDADTASPIFFYLDAHWNEDLPLAEELQIIFNTWKKPVVMVDDFKVPDSDYCYDDYGDGKALTMDYVNNIADISELTAYFPTAPVEEESGAKRGCVVLASNEKIIQLLEQCKTLRTIVA
jgi:hypothetical protein